MDSDLSYSDSDEIEFSRKRRKGSKKAPSKRQQVIDNFMNGILDPEYLCRPNKKKPGAFIVSKRKTPLKIQDSNAPVKVDAPANTPNPLPEKIPTPETPSTNIDFSKYIANQETVNNNFNSALSKLCTTLEKIEKQKAKRKAAPKKPKEPKEPKEPKATKATKKKQEEPAPEPEPEPAPEPEPEPVQEPEPEYYQQTYYQPVRRMRPRDYINFLA
ncbi:hypothetical protein TRFO_42468 [Tritrichomonas foetus]|uniref:Uncharacterized protein n=1 Tax=Tritrichomonas foetus TaxID=1144522 RepID=A0A1J4KWI1_9EUKA|nr:hypothetical protein TRFO_42468 [Tritrichomonas foetus]|eukprot:OHT15591.1 hypothetical protein TRFO_42468 [Tritrichomonas foetus]